MCFIDGCHDNPRDGWLFCEAHIQLMGLEDNSGHPMAISNGVHGAPVSGERHPCDYCGTMLDEDDCVESDIPAVNGPTLHSATQCREYVYACLVAYKRDAATFRQALHDAADALWLASQGAPLASAKVAAELAHKVLPEGRYPSHDMRLEWNQGYDESDEE